MRDVPKDHPGSHSTFGARLQDATISVWPASARLLCCRPWRCCGCRMQGVMVPLPGGARVKLFELFPVLWSILITWAFAGTGSMRICTAECSTGPALGPHPVLSPGPALPTEPQQGVGPSIHLAGPGPQRLPWLLTRTCRHPDSKWGLQRGQPLAAGRVPYRQPLTHGRLALDLRALPTPGVALACDPSCAPGSQAPCHSWPTFVSPPLARPCDGARSGGPPPLWPPPSSPWPQAP